MRALFISLVGMALGAKMFGCLTGIFRCVALGRSITIDSLLDTGIVYYGGLLGLLVVYSLCIKLIYSRLDCHALNVLAVCIPIFHAISRIGCFLSGCCYGKIYHGILAIQYTTVIGGSVDVNSRFPVQLVEALFEFLIFLYLVSLLRQPNWKSKNLLLQYLFIYSFGRFFLEFFRGDFRRGVIHGVSFSQFISILILASVILYLLRKKHLDIIEGG